jgi:DNA-binding CsgD family transcriptional regulator
VLAVMLAAGHTHAEVGRRFGTSRSAVSQAWKRNRKLRSSVNRLEHAADLDEL